MNYPKEWDDLSRKERRRKIKELKKQNIEKKKQVMKIRNISIVIIIIVVLIAGYTIANKKTPQQIVLEKEVETVSLEGRVEEFPIEGSEHVSSGTNVNYKTNPPTSGEHLAQAENWGVYTDEIDDKTAVHELEHGGIWISYKDVDEEIINKLKEIGRFNPGSVIVSPRSDNDDKIAVVSWGRMMKLEEADQAVIQKYIDTYKNDSPEKMAR